MPRCIPVVELEYVTPPLVCVSVTLLVVSVTVVFKVKGEGCATDTLEELEFEVTEVTGTLELLASEVLGESFTGVMVVRDVLCDV